MGLFRYLFFEKRYSTKFTRYGLRKQQTFFAALLWRGGAIRRGTAVHSAGSCDRALIARPQPLRPADLPAPAVRVAPARTPGPNTSAHAPACRPQTARWPAALSRLACRWAG